MKQKTKKIIMNTLEAIKANPDILEIIGTTETEIEKIQKELES